MADTSVADKVCSACSKTLPLSRFSKNCRTKDGLCHACKSCRDVYRHASCVWEPSLPGERWRYATDTNRTYSVSSFGRVRRNVNVGGCRAGRLLKPEPGERGHLRVRFSIDGKAIRRLVHRLVAQAFVANPNPANDIVVNHLDGNPMNNRWDNLEWTTQQGNSHHAAHVLLRYPRNEDNLRAKLSNHQVRIIRRLIEQRQMTQVEMARIFCVSKHTIQAIKAGRNWKYLDA
jgi:DNA-binding XRE family transcriptional regulator